MAPWIEGARPRCYTGAVRKHTSHSIPSLSRSTALSGHHPHPHAAACQSSRCSVILPARNEASTIAAVVRDVQLVLPHAEVLVVDNASTDRTATLARQAGAYVIQEARIGKGAAMSAGARVASGKILLFMDGDRTYRARDLRRLAQALEAQQLDAVYGVRSLISPGMTPLRRCGNWLLTRLASWLYGPTQDLMTGMVAIRAAVWNRLSIHSQGFDVDTELFIQLRRGGYRVAERPIVYRGRRYGSKLRPWLDGWRYARMLMAECWQPFYSQGIP